MTGAAVLADDLGPRGRRQVRVASIVVAIAAVLLIVAVVRRLDAKGQFESYLWTPFTDWSTITFYLGGLANTVLAASIAMVLAIVVGGLMALGRMAKNGIVRFLCGVYVEFFRAEPVLLMMLFASLVLPAYHLPLPAVGYVVLGLALYNSAMLGEIFRAGILSLDRGQREAASSLGLGYWQSMFIVIVPQVIRRMIPSTVSQLVALLKDTSYGFVVAYEELLRRAQITGEYFHDPLQAIFIATLIYIAVNLLLSRLAALLERRQGQGKSKAARLERVVDPGGLVQGGGVPT